MKRRESMMILTTLGTIQLLAVLAHFSLILSSSYFLREIVWCLGIASSIIAGLLVVIAKGPSKSVVGASVVFFPIVVGVYFVYGWLAPTVNVKNARIDYAGNEQQYKTIAGYGNAILAVNNCRKVIIYAGYKSSYSECDSVRKHVKIPSADQEQEINFFCYGRDVSTITYTHDSVTFEFDGHTCAMTYDGRSATFREL